MLLIPYRACQQHNQLGSSNTIGVIGQVSDRCGRQCRAGALALEDRAKIDSSMQRWSTLGDLSLERSLGLTEYRLGGAIVIHRHGMQVTWFNWGDRVGLCYIQLISIQFDSLNQKALWGQYLQLIMIAYTEGTVEVKVILIKM
jgi:hypothetical protein